MREFVLKYPSEFLMGHPIVLWAIFALIFISLLWCFPRYLKADPFWTVILLMLTSPIIFMVVLQPIISVLTTTFICGSIYVANKAAKGSGR